MGITILTASYYGIRCIVQAIKFFRGDDLISLREYMKVGKRGLILYFLINFIYHALFFMILMAASRGIFLFGPIPMLLIPLMLFTYLAVIFTSSFSIAFILLLKKKRMMEPGTMIFNIFMQLNFVLDIIGMVFLLKRFKKDMLVHAAE